MPPFRRATLATGFVKNFLFSKKEYAQNEKADALDLGLIFVSSSRRDRQNGGCPLSDVQPLRLGPIGRPRKAELLATFGGARC
jgi:hypothetical protein